MKKTKKNSVAIVMPAYNEGSVIYEVITLLQSALFKAGYDFMIIVVDDGSKDNTTSEALRAGAFTIEHILNTGSGGSTATGLSYAQQKGYEIAITVDADGQHSPDDVINGIRRIQKNDYDLLIGSRLIENRGMSRVKRIGNKGLSFITFLLFGVSVTDSQSGLRVFSKKALDSLKWKTSGYEFASEMLWRAKQQGLRIGEYPIKAIYTDYSRAKGQNNWNAFNIIRALLRRRMLELFGE